VISDQSALPVLIVEDDAPTQNLLRTVLLRSGHSSDIASNGAEAIELLRSRDYVLVVLDIMMPGVSGREVVEFLSASASPVPVIICSAAGLSALTGFDSTVVRAIVRKPFDITELSEAVARVVASR
jgi:CheY-like chemotaxis protein